MYKYNDEIYNTIDELLDAVEGEICVHAKLEDDYHTWLNELFGDPSGKGIWIYNKYYDVGLLFKKGDLITYLCGFNHYATDFISKLHDIAAKEVLAVLSDLDIEIEYIETEETE